MDRNTGSAPTVRVYVIENPSDDYTIAGDDFAAVVLAVTMVGGGKYMLTAEDEQQVLPAFIFGGHDEWARERFGMSFDDLYEATERTAIADALDSIVIGSRADRKNYDAALSAIPDADARRSFRDTWHDNKRSSLNDIAGRAWHQAMRLRAVAAAAEPAP